MSVAIGHRRDIELPLLALTVRLPVKLGLVVSGAAGGGVTGGGVTGGGVTGGGVTGGGVTGGGVTGGGVTGGVVVVGGGGVTVIPTDDVFVVSWMGSDALPAASLATRV